MTQGELVTVCGERATEIEASRMVKSGGDVENRETVRNLNRTGQICPGGIGGGGNQTGCGLVQRNSHAQTGDIGTMDVSKDAARNRSDSCVPVSARRHVKLAHTFALEKGGPTLLELRQMMEKEANDQGELMRFVPHMFDDDIERNDVAMWISELGFFEQACPPKISPADYIRRVMQFAGCSDSCYLVSAIYMERLQRMEHSLHLTSCNFHRLFFVSILTAAKYIDDNHYGNRYWARIGGISVQELNALELEFLFLLKFQLSVQREEYDAFVKSLLRKNSMEGMSIDTKSCTLDSKSSTLDVGIDNNVDDNVDAVEDTVSPDDSIPNSVHSNASTVEVEDNTSIVDSNASTSSDESEPCSFDDGDESAPCNQEESR